MLEGLQPLYAMLTTLAGASTDNQNPHGLLGVHNYVEGL